MWWSLGGKDIVTWTNRDVVPANGLTRVFTQNQWKALCCPGSTVTTDTARELRRQPRWQRGMSG